MKKRTSKHAALALWCITLLVVKQSSKIHGFVVVPPINSPPKSSALVKSVVNASYKKQSAVTLYAQKFQGKNREEELGRLAIQMKVGIPKLKQVLQSHRQKLDDSSEKAEWIDWVLEVGPSKQSSSIKSTAAVTKTKAAAPKKKTTNVISSRRPKRPASVEERSYQRKQEAKSRQAEALQDPTLLTNVKFAERNDLHPSSKRALTEIMGLKTMTEIQSKTYAAAASGSDVLGRARTGTGKTLAFLIPAVERILQSSTFIPGKAVGCVIISPTRELATQIANQAEQLTTYHSDLTVQVMFGGTKKGRDINMLSKRLPSILVATPGRLLDHLTETKIQGRKFGDDIMTETDIVVLDETDRLLDMGFRREIRKIFSFLTRKDKRQTLLFSATIPKELKSVMAESMRKDFIEVDCIGKDGDGEAARHTNSRVKQSHVVLPDMDRYVSSVLEIVTQAMEETTDEDGEAAYKVVVFFPTARMVQFFAELFNQGLNIPVIELHSKKSQSYRNKASDRFRKATNGILFTSDVSARGVDYPDVTRVIQFGIPESREQYIHRLGRTGRAGKEGNGLLVLSPFESMFLSELKGLDVPKILKKIFVLSKSCLFQIPSSIIFHLVPSFSMKGRAGKEGNGLLVLSPFESMFLSELKGLDVPRDEDIMDMLRNPANPDSQDLLDGALDRIRSGDAKLTPSAQSAYQAFLGYYLGQMKRTKVRSREELVQLANAFSRSMGLKDIPKLEKRAAGKMGLKGVAGIVIGARDTFDRAGGGGVRRPNHHSEHVDGRKAPPGRGRRRNNNSSSKRSNRK
eukprot:CAMPEP_0195308052 /NCGR_PEP_ID=MMETSP0707-20130614/38025_1 /TAXON_ID=33640 /ORGANISM="Asterionellopsis glacialis, Strain CCMP134" /LENGTH=798 /DNA_ID=CAMNT_0040372311 /DNA_START=94 /DNA_END=2491 /DNA_ORIENTATION=+